MTELTLKVTALSVEPNQWEGEALVVGVFDKGVAENSLGHCPVAVVSEVRRVLEAGWMRGKAGESLTLPAPVGVSVQRLLLVGLGKEPELEPDGLRQAGARIGAACDAGNIGTALVLLPRSRPTGLKEERVAELLAEGALLGTYRFEAYRSQPENNGDERHTLRELTLAVTDKHLAKAKERLNWVVSAVLGVYLARDLANQPGNMATPEYLARSARQLAAEHGLGVTVLEEEALAAAGCNGLLAVGGGSVHPPRLIVLEYRRAGDRPPLVVVGKGITFDSGGISIKPAAGMEAMKYDMSGAAAVLGFLRALAELKVKANVVGLVATAENMPSGSAQRPGDIIRLGKGLFVEVINTDAEGRLVLADALHYAERFDPKAIVDLATLTGACAVALGPEAAGLMGNDQRLIDALLQAGEHVGERVWQLPLFKEYHEQLKSAVADLKNVGGREGGAITAACFLSRFVGEKRRWAHLDIAGVDNYAKGKKAYVPEGSVGWGVRLLLRLLEQELK